MAHGQPDYGAQAAKSTIYGQADMAELAVRLGSIVSYDRLGDVFFLEDFSNGLTQWLSANPPAGSPAIISPERFRSRGFSCKVTTNASAINFSGIEKYFPLPVYSNIGIEVSFSIDANMTDIVVIIRVYEAGEYNEFRARVRTIAGQLLITDSVAGEVDVGYTGRLEWEETLFHTIKLAGDYTTNKYSRILLDDFSVPIPAYSAVTVGGGFLKTLNVAILGNAGAVADNLYWIDDIILTQNEP